MTNEEDWNVVQQALGNKKFDWRTIEGLAKETKLNGERVIAAMDAHSEEIVRSALPSNEGKAIYSLRENYSKRSSTFSKILSGATYKVLP